MVKFMNKELMEILDIIFRSLISLVTLFFVTKMLGKKQVSQLSLFDYVIGISIGNFAAEATINLESDYIHGIVPVFVFGLIACLVQILTMKSIVLRRFFIGTPTVLIQDGKILYRGLKKVKFDINDLLEVARDAGYFDLGEISYAIMEANGDVSFLPKGEYKSVTIKDMKLKVEKDGLCANVVIDGNLMEDNIENMHKTKEWIRKELKIKGYKVVIPLDKYKKLINAKTNGKTYVYKLNTKKTIKQKVDIYNKKTWKKTTKTVKSKIYIYVAFDGTGKYGGSLPKNQYVAEITTSNQHRYGNIICKKWLFGYKQSKEFTKLNSAKVRQKLFGL